MSHICIATHPIDLSTGQMLAPGEITDLPDGKLAAHDEQLIADGLLMEHDTTAPEGDEYDAMTVADLRAATEARGLTVKGTGSNGAPLADDYRAALRTPNQED